MIFYADKLCNIMETLQKTTKKIDITAGFIRDVAIMAAAGAPKAAIIKKMNTTPFIVNEVLAMEEAKLIIAEVNESALSEAKTRIKQGVAGLASEAVRVVKDNLKKGSLEAAKTVFRVLGVDTGDNTAQNNSFQLILATDKDKETITVKDAKYEDDKTD